MEPSARQQSVAWLAALAAAWLALAILGHRTRDPDSRLYAEMAARMAEAPAAGWIAPDFPPGWYMSGRFREHPVGLLVPAALLARIGYPPEQAAYALNALYQCATLVLVPLLAATLVSGFEARALAWLLQLLPIAFTYRVRANHEQALLLCLVLALVGTDWSRRHARFAVLTALGLVGMLLVKGIFAVFGPLLCALWLVASRRDPERAAGAAWAWAGLGLAVAAMAVMALVYEWLYRIATGEPFWSFYVSRQLGVATAGGTESAVLQKASNVLFYLGRIVWFAFPWSLALLVAGWQAWPFARPWACRRRHVRRGHGAALRARLQPVRPPGRSLRLPGLLRRGAGGAIAALQLWPRLRRFAARFDRPWVPAAVFWLAFVVHLLAGPLGVPTVKIEASLL
jgi:4-amino-4-deoxy-L-arabinose transferase-like glycosyltransferase